MIKAPRILAAHRPGRLVFAILTLTVALAGVVANYSLSYKAIDAFNRVLSYSDTHTMLVTARSRDALAITKGQADAEHLHDFLLDVTEQAVGPEVEVVQVRRFSTALQAGSVQKAVTVYAVGQGFFEAIGTPLTRGALTWRVKQDGCGFGASLFASLTVESEATVQLSGIPCRAAFDIDLPQRPPFGDLNNAAFVAHEEESFDPRAPVAVYILLSSDADALDATVLQNRLSAALDTTYLQFWSSAQNQVEAQRLKRIISSVSNGLGAVILLVGSASIASLMSFSVAERRREIAIRITLGASRRNILTQFLGEALAIGALALVLGITAGIYLSDYLEKPLNEFLIVGDMTETAFSLVPLFKTTLAFLFIAALSALGPALKAAQTDPALILRNS